METANNKHSLQNKHFLLVENLPFAFAYHQIVTDDYGDPVDYIFLEVNTAFENKTGLKRNNIIGRRVTEVLPSIKKAEFDWIGIYGKVALEGKSLSFEQYFEPLKRWYNIQVYSDEPGYFITVFSEITAVKRETASMQKLLKLTERMLVSDTADLNYQEIAETLQQLSGAKFTAVNTYEEDRTKTITRAITGLPQLVDKASNALGFKITGQSWDIIPDRLRKIEGGKLVRFNNLYETAMGSLSKTTSSMLHKLTGIGDIYVIELAFVGQKALGDVIFFLSKNKDIENREAIELYASQLASLLARFKSEISLQLKSEELDRYFNNSLDLLCVANTDGNFVRVNKRWQETLGYSAAELEGRSFLEFVHPDDMASTLKAISQLTSQVEVTSFKNRYLCSNGSYRWIEWRSKPQGDLIYAVARDITETLKVEEELNQQRDLLNQFFSQSLTGFFFMMIDEPVTWNEEADKEKILDYVFHHQRMTKVNQALLNQYGAAEDDFIGKTPYELFKHDLEHGRYIWRGLFDQGRWHVETDERRMDGTPMIIDGDYICLYDNKGRITGHFGVQVDITEQKKADITLQESEQRYREILETTAEGFYEVDLKGNIVASNRAAAEMLGYREEEIVGKNYRSLCKDPDAVFREFNQAFTKGKSKFSVLMEMIRKDGSIRIADLSVSLIYDQGGHINGFRGMGRDVTEKVKLEEHLKHVSLHDELTGLYNRRYFENELARLDRSREYPVAVISADLDGLKLINDTLGHSEGDHYLHTGAELLKNSLRGSDILARVGGDEFALLLPRTSQEAAEEISARIRRQIDEHNRNKGTLPLSISFGLAINKEGKLPLEETYKHADAAMYRDKLTRSKKARSAIVSSLLASLSKRSDLGEGASELVPELCIQLAQAVSLDDNRMTNLQLLAQVYDLGKVKMPDHIIHSSLMRKAGELTEEDREAIRNHPEAGYRIASASPELVEVADLILKHHENYDGSGYPLGLKGEEIPLECRILAVACAYSAMISPRAYAQTFSHDEAIDELKRCAGSQFDPRLVNAFIMIMEV